MHGRRIIQTARIIGSWMKTKFALMSTTLLQKWAMEPAIARISMTPFTKGRMVCVKNKYGLKDNNMWIHPPLELRGMELTLIQIQISAVERNETIWEHNKGRKCIMFVKCIINTMTHFYAKYLCRAKRGCRSSGARSRERIHLKIVSSLHVASKTHGIVQTVLKIHKSIREDQTKKISYNRVILALWNNHGIDKSNDKKNQKDEAKDGKIVKIKTKVLVQWSEQRRDFGGRHLNGWL